LGFINFAFYQTFLVVDVSVFGKVHLHNGICLTYQFVDYQVSNLESQMV